MGAKYPIHSFFMAGWKLEGKKEESADFASSKKRGKNQIT
jgi:hypothetical protein